MKTDYRPGPVLLEILKSAFQSVANEMALTVELAAYSVVITEGRDFSGSLYDRDGFLVCQGHEDLPIHVGTTQHSVQAVHAAIGIENMREGDMYIMNDPYLGSTHANDIRLVMPLFHAGEVVAFVANTAHWSDVGGMVPGSFCVEASECFQEGIRIPPATIVSEGKLNEELKHLILTNIRMPYESEGDLQAQIAACLAGNTRFAELVEKYGIEVVTGGMEAIQDYSERMIRTEIERLPDGDYYWEDFIDEDPGTGEPKAVRLTLTVDGDRLVYDFTKTDPVASFSMNTTFPGTFAGVIITLKALFSEIPLSAGLMRAIEIKTTPNTLVDARPPSPVGGMGPTSWEKLACCAISVFSKIAPERTSAGSYNLSVSFWGGKNPLTDRNYVCYVWSEGGLGGTMKQDGPSAMQSYFDATTQNVPAEILERSAPILVEEYSLREGSAGAGEQRGGLGTRRRIRLVDIPENDAVLSVVGDRRKFRGPGLLGGNDSSTQTDWLYSREGEKSELGLLVSNHAMGAGEALEIESMGGAGFGDPLLRDPDRVLDDVRNDYLTIEIARREYGVVIDEIDRDALKFEIDLEATAAERERLRAEVPAAT
jgi:N-methylhydantoinase B